MLDREEYVEQAYFFRVLSERIKDNIPMQEALITLQDEVLSTTRLPLAIDFLRSELKHTGGLSSAMARLAHYFSPFQTFVMESAEEETGRFDLRVALEVLRHHARYLVDSPQREGIFLYQFETLCRNRLSYDRGLLAMAGDPIYDQDWRAWILMVRRQIGIVGLAELIYVRSGYYLRQRQLREGAATVPEKPILFAEKEGRIALASRQKDPLLFFAALQRQLGYPVVPRPQPPDATPELLPQLARRIERLETRVKLVEEEQRGELDITKFYGKDTGPAPDWRGGA
jgi:hypothetical protein